MPEITLPGLRETANGPSEQQHAMRKEAVKNGQVKLWAFTGTEAECEEAWVRFLLEGCPGSVVLS